MAVAGSNGSQPWCHGVQFTCCRPNFVHRALLSAPSVDRWVLYKSLVIMFFCFNLTARTLGSTSVPGLVLYPSPPVSILWIRLCDPGLFPVPLANSLDCFWARTWGDNILIVETCWNHSTHPESSHGGAASSSSSSSSECGWTISINTRHHPHFIQNPSALPQKYLLVN